MSLSEEMYKISKVYNQQMSMTDMLTLLLVFVIYVLVIGYVVQLCWNNTLVQIFDFRPVSLGQGILLLLLSHLLLR
jgi:hypothetical protein